MAEEPQRHAGLRQAVRAFAVLSGIGIYFAVFVAICIFLGYEFSWCHLHALPPTALGQYRLIGVSLMQGLASFSRKKFCATLAKWVSSLYNMNCY